MENFQLGLRRWGPFIILAVFTLATLIMWGAHWQVPLITAVSIGIILCTIATFISTSNKWDREQNNGLVALVAITVALQACVVMFVSDGAPTIRIILPLLLLVVAVSIASNDWRPRSVRIAVAIGLLFIGGTLVNIGRDANSPTSLAKSELASIEAAVSSMEPSLQDKVEFLKKARDEAFGKLELQISAVQSANSTANGLQIKNAEAILAEKGNSAVEFNRAVSQFNNQFPSDPMPVLASLKDAVGAASDAFNAAASPPTPDAVLKAIAGARSSAKDTEQGLPLAMAITRLELAKYQQSVYGRAADDAAVKGAKAALEVVQATPPKWRPDPMGLLEALGAGGEQVVSNVSAVKGTETPLALDATAWILLAALALAFWRQIERRSARQLPGPVSVDLTPFKSASVDTSDLQKAVFRTAVLRNVSEPAAVPGATLLKSLTDLTELATPAGWLGHVAAAIRNVLETPNGYTVKAEVVPKDSSSEACSVLVRVADRETGQDETMASITGVSAPAACRAAGYWAAAAVLERSRRTPSWSKWTLEGASALAVFNESAEVGSPEAPSTELANALAKAPDSGLILHKRADLADLDRKHFEALSLYARAVAAHPRYPAARYRLAVSVNMLSRDVQKQWLTATANDRARVIGQLARAGRAMTLGDDSIHTIRTLDRDPSKLADHFKEIAEALFAQLLVTGRPSHMLRMSERDVFWPLPRIWDFHQGLPWARAEWLIRSAKLATCTPASGLTPEQNEELKEVIARASRSASWWQLRYNLACHFALNKNPQEAIEWLEKALEAPGGGQMAGGWLGADPDLETLHDTPRFNWLLKQVDDTRKKADEHA